jgi:hypothetical protein
MKSESTIRASSPLVTQSNLLRTSALIVLMALPTPALAYLDPGTGSMLLQGLIALIGGILSTAVMYWRSVVSFIRSLFRGKKPHDSSGDHKQ